MASLSSIIKNLVVRDASGNNVVRLRHTLTTTGTSLNYGNCDWQITPEPTAKFIQLPDKPSPVDDFTYFMRVK